MFYKIPSFVHLLWDIYHSECSLCCRGLNKIISLTIWAFCLSGFGATTQIVFVPASGTCLLLPGNETPSEPLCFIPVWWSRDPKVSSVPNPGFWTLVHSYHDKDLIWYLLNTCSLYGVRFFWFHGLIILVISVNVSMVYRDLVFLVERQQRVWC